MNMAKTIIIFGNSGAGKSTLAKSMAKEYHLAHLDLDTLAWHDVPPPVRKPLEESAHLIDKFITENKHRVIEGGYSDLLQYAINSTKTPEIFFLNPGIPACINNCINRPWEPHKYKSAAEQNSNLDMLLDWVRQYPNREDSFSLKAHQKLFTEFTGKKTEYGSNHIKL